MMEDTETLMGEFSNEMKYLLPDEAVTEVELEETLKDYASIDMLNEKFQEAIKAGFKTEIVDVLPTENISHQIIYLVPNFNTEEQNIYDEFIYTTDSKWEPIGSTKIDLSNYYTKEEVNNTINEAIDNMPEQETLKGIYEFTYTGEDKGYNDELLTFFEKVINESVGTQPYVLITYNNTNQTELVKSNSRITNTGTSYNFTPAVPLEYQGSLSNFYYPTIFVRGEWIDGVYKCTNNTQFLRTTTNATDKFYLSLDGNNGFIPTGDYHPATKKYVDDSVESVKNNDFIFINSGDQSDELKAKLSELITNNIDGVVNGFIGEVGATNKGTLLSTETIKTNKTEYILSNTYIVAPKSDMYNAALKIVGTWTDNIFTVTSLQYMSYGVNHVVLPTNNVQSYTPTSDYHPATKKYVDDSMANIDIGESVFVIRYNDTSEETKLKLENYLNKYIGSTCQIMLNGYPNHGISTICSEILCCNIDTRETNLLFFNKSVVAYQSDHYYNSLSVQVEWNETKDKLSITKITFTNSSKTKVLATNNSSSYTPTGDYNPATKKYVDDSVANLVGGDCKIIEINSETNLWELETGIYYVNASEENQITLHDSKMSRSSTNKPLIFYISKDTNYTYKHSFSSTYMSVVKMLTAGSNSSETYSINLSKVITSNNTKSYTPTSDYHPAHKKYVDDSISNALGDINTILATLTTVEEGE